MWRLLTSLLCCLTACTLGLVHHVSSSAGQDCALLSSQAQHVQYQVTDGREVVTSTWDRRKQLVSCSVQGDETEVGYFVTQCRGEAHQAGAELSYGGFAEWKLSCQLFLRAASPGVQPRARDTAQKGQHHRAKRGFTYPGTLWCGAGNIAETYGDLGEHTETDSCCREHDHCSHVIHPFTSSYGYRNFRWHTISLCQCDDRFKDCLRRVNDTTSRVVGQAFFNVIQVPCFELTYTQQCVERYWYGWCKKNGTVEIAVPKESGLYDYGGKLIDQVPKEKDKDAQPAPTLEMLPENPTLGQVIQATEDLLKLMMTVSPSTSEISKVETKGKKKEKKERKHKKGKGLKGKKKKHSQSEDKSPAKDIWGQNVVKHDGSLTEHEPLNSIDLSRKQDVFNDVLNDEPLRSSDETPHSTTIPITRYQQLKSVISPHPQELKPYTERPQKKSRHGKNGRRQRKKKHRDDCVSENQQ